MCLCVYEGKTEGTFQWVSGWTSNPGQLYSAIPTDYKGPSECLPTGVVGTVFTAYAMADWWCQRRYILLVKWNELLWHLLQCLHFYFFIRNSDMFFNTYIELQAVNYRVAQLAQEHMVIHFNFLLAYMFLTFEQILLKHWCAVFFFSVVLWVSLTTFYGTVNGRRVELSVMLFWNTFP